MFLGYKTLYESPLCFALCEWLYPVPPLPEKRTKQLKVICVGLPRSGTESLSKALLQLGYDDVSHGIVQFWIHNAHTAKTFHRLGLLRATGCLPADPATLRTEYFDRVLGACEATTDIPSVWFAHELLAAYPEARVIVNKRSSPAAWKESFRAAVMPLMDSWSYYFWSFFQAELFWGMAMSYYLHGRVLLHGDFERNAERAFIDHYARLEEKLQAQKRPYLEWKVEDGWEPLSEFLDKSVPSEPFPDGNRAPEFMPKLMQVDGARFAQAKRNARMLLTVIALVIVGGVGYYRGGELTLPSCDTLTWARR